MVVDELTANGIMEPNRLFESPYTDHGRPDIIFPKQDVQAIVGIVRDVTKRANVAAVA